MEYEQRDLFTHLPCGRGAACTEVRQQTFPDEMTDSIGLQLFFNCAYIVAHLISLFYGQIGRKNTAKLDVLLELKLTSTPSYIELPVEIFECWALVDACL